MSEAARTRRDDARYEPRMTVPGRDMQDASVGSTDPLAELARLVGQDDPFRNVFRPKAAPVPSQVQPGAGGAFDEDRHAAAKPHAAEPAIDADEVHGSAVRYADGGGHRDDHIHGEPVAYDDHGAYDDHHDDGHGHHERHPGHDPYVAHDDQYAAAEQAAHPDDAGFADERSMDGYATASALPDLWARDERAPTGEAPEIDRGESPGLLAGPKSSARRPVMVLAAVLVLTGGGLAATFLAKGNATPGAASVPASRGAPTIMAATGPTKVKVDDSSAVAPEDQDAALLNKNGNVSSGPVKIVSSQEQPADLTQLPKSDLADGARPLPQASPSPFPEPKKVKTFLVHPDGTMLSSDGAAAAPAAEAAVPSTPKTASRGGTTPKAAAPAAPTSIAALSADPAPAVDPTAAAVGASTPAKAARQPASPGVRAPSPKPTETADSAPNAGGSYGVQLASSPVEAEANAAFARLKKKFPTQLGPYTATVHRAETGDKPVYRVRVGGMGQDEAKTLCAQLQGAGGSCFVMHN